MTKRERAQLHARQGRAYRARIRRDLNRATAQEWLDGATWYERAHAQCRALAERCHVSTETAAGVVAAISPGLSWDINVYQAQRILDRAAGRGQKGLDGKVPDEPPSGVPTYSRANVEKAWLIAHGAAPLETLGGPKVRAFYALLADPRDAEAVCVDGHIAQAARAVRYHVRHKAGHVSTGEYERIARAVRAEAQRVGLLAHQAQAIVWLVQKARPTQRDDETPF